MERTNNSGRLRQHFMYWHWKANVSNIHGGPEPLSRYYHCGIQIPESQLIKQRWTARCSKATEIWIRQRDVEMAYRCREMELNMYRREGGALVEGVENFKYLGGPWIKRKMTRRRYG